MLCQLIEGKVGAGDLQKNSGLSQSAFSPHLSVLRKSKLIHARKSYQHVFYSLSDPKIDALIKALHQIFYQPQ